VVGAFHNILMEKALRQTFQDTIRCLGIRMKLEIEKRQQVLINFTSTSQTQSEQTHRRNTNYVQIHITHDILIQFMPRFYRRSTYACKKVSSLPSVSVIFLHKLCFCTSLK